MRCLILLVFFLPYLAVGAPPNFNNQDALNQNSIPIQQRVVFYQHPILCPPPPSNAYVSYYQPPPPPQMIQYPPPPQPQIYSIPSAGFIYRPNIGVASNGSQAFAPYNPPTGIIQRTGPPAQNIFYTQKGPVMFVNQPIYIPVPLALTFGFSSISPAAPLVPLIANFVSTASAPSTGFVAIPSNIAVPADISSNSVPPTPFESSETSESLSCLRQNIIAALNFSTCRPVVEGVFSEENRAFLSKFFFGLHEEPFSRAQSTGFHLNVITQEYSRLLELDVLHIQSNFTDYFEYIKEHHIKAELATSSPESVVSQMKAAVISLINSNFGLPDVIDQLLELAHPLFTENDAAELCSYLLNCISNSSFCRCTKCLTNKLQVIESFMDYVPFSSNTFLLSPSDPLSNMNFRVLLHFAPLFRCFLGFRQVSVPELTEIIQKAKLNSNGSRVENFYALYFLSLELMIKRAYWRVKHKSSLDVDEYEARLENLIYNILIQYSSQKTYFDWCIRWNSFFLEDSLIYHVDSYDKTGFEISEFAIDAYKASQNCGFTFLRHMSILISVEDIRLDEFQELAKTCLLDAGIPKEFVLLLENLIAAVEDVQFYPIHQLTWEPSEAYLRLQDELFKLNSCDKVIEKSGNYIGDISVLFMAAMVILSRQRCLPISFFNGFPTLDGYSWEDVLAIINFKLELYSVPIEEGGAVPKYPTNIKCTFWADALTKFGQIPDIETLIEFHREGGYKSLSFSPPPKEEKI